MTEIKRTIGGNRLKSGEKMNVYMHGYERSNFNLNKIWRSSMACGTLVPCYVNIGLNGDTFDIDTKAIVRTIPTKAPLFGTYKFQIDYFVVPLRLYNGQLHNNPINVGMNMQNIKFQTVDLYHDTSLDEYASDQNTRQINESSLLKYLGLSGIGKRNNNTSPLVHKEINATPILAYYDIFKNYYANKQEQNFYYIGNTQTTENTQINWIEGWYYQESGIGTTWKPDQISGITKINANNIWTYVIKGVALNTDISFAHNGAQEHLQTLIDRGEIELISADDKQITFKFTNTAQLGQYDIFTGGQGLSNNIDLKPCKLEVLDTIRELCLSQSPTGETIAGGNTNKIVNLFGHTNIEGLEQLPRFYNFNGKGNLIYSQYGLCVKTYQNDMFNNWLDKEIVDGNNGIREVTRIDVSNGLELDALNLAQKVYNMLNRIAISGGTYQDWQEVNYGEKVMRLAETPIYCGGASFEIGFEEVVSTSDTLTEQQNSALGSLAGKGTIISGNTDKVVIHIEEPSIIMGIASITPRIDYTQGNKWYLTELKNYGDLHVPALDTIGYQDLLGEQAAWFAAGMPNNSTPEETTKSPGYGKLPAWINYMTDVNEAYGDFANNSKAGYMILQRNYNEIITDTSKDISGIEDFTSYIDPRKYNYAFAYTGLDAQNFWIQIAMNIDARRKMSRKIIPTL